MLKLQLVHGQQGVRLDDLPGLSVAKGQLSVQLKEPVAVGVDEINRDRIRVVHFVRIAFELKHDEKAGMHHGQRARHDSRKDPEDAQLAVLRDGGIIRQDREADVHDGDMEDALWSVFA